MKGAVQGAATTTASTPVKKAPAPPGRRDSRPPAPPSANPCAAMPTLNTPDRFRPTASISRASPAITPGDCSWKPQPTACPAARSVIRATARIRKVVRTPARNASPSRRASPGSWAEADRAAAFMARIGNTHGIRFRISPPIRANSAACRKTPKPVGAAPSARAPSPVVPASGSPTSAMISHAPSDVDSTPAIGPFRPPVRIARPAVRRQAQALRPPLARLVGRMIDDAALEGKEIDVGQVLARSGLRP